MRYDAAVAREKNTSRAEARKRTREMTRAELLAAEAEEDDELDDAAAAQPESPRPAMFKMPNVRADIAALPSILRSRRILWVPLLLLLIGFAAVLALPGLTPDIQVYAAYYVQFFFTPPALFTFFIAGFFAPRASYLVGALYGLVAGILWGLAFSGILGNPLPIAAPLQATDTAVSFVVAMFYGLIFGTMAAALAAWYRDFLRGMQERGRARRAGREVEERLKRREERQEARRIAKQPPSS